MYYISLCCISMTCIRLDQKRGSKPFLLPFLFKIFALDHQDVSNYLESVKEKQNVPSTLHFIKQTSTNEFQWGNGTKPTSRVNFLYTLSKFLLFLLRFDQCDIFNCWSVFVLQICNSGTTVRTEVQFCLKVFFLRTD